ncbi:MAG: FAD-dependent oxidoreductase [Hyphomicrobiales bacterium]|nr:FAD-dependent oxidoreductase [Hyphomicrobiales bacterium]
MRTDVAIVGGGLSGLYAARLLLDAGIEFQLLEARNRFGGRILSVSGMGDPSPGGFDLGPSWFWPGMHPRMARVVDGLGLRAFPQHTEGDVVVERSRFEAVQRFPTLPQEPPSMRLAGGTGAIVSALVGALPAGHLHLGAQVSRVTIRDGGAVLLFRDDGADSELVARQVILALPPRLLASTVDFQPALDSETLLRWRHTATWMAPHAKFFALYDRPFWRESGLSGTAQSAVGPLVEIHDATLASGSAALFGFVGLDRRQRMAVGEEALGRAAIAQLVRLFGALAGQPQATLFKDWTADAFTATEADMQAEGHPLPDPRPWISGSWAPYVSLAGSETSATDPGYLAGALDAAERAVAEIVRRL